MASPDTASTFDGGGHLERIDRGKIRHNNIPTTTAQSIYALRGVATTMEENEANVANYDELASHVTDIESRLPKLSGAKDQAREDLHELRADYYERAIQMRQMRCQTLEAIVTETTKKLNSVAEQAQWLTFQRRIVVACVVSVAILMIAMDSDPELLTKITAALQTTEAMTHGGCLLVGGMTMWWARRKPSRRSDPKKAM